MFLSLCPCSPSVCLREADRSDGRFAQKPSRFYRTRKHRQASSQHSQDATSASSDSAWSSVHTRVNVGRIGAQRNSGTDASAEQRDRRERRSCTPTHTLRTSCMIIVDHGAARKSHRRRSLRVPSPPLLAALPPPLLSSDACQEATIISQRGGSGRRIQQPQRMSISECAVWQACSLWPTAASPHRNVIGCAT